jgi:brefeldin A-inhibited guanine nucleotide-exchange protein
MPAMPEWMLPNEKQRQLHTEALETAFTTEMDDSTTQEGTESESAGSLPSDFMERTMSMKEGLTDSLPVDLDPQTKEPMNEAIQCTVEACSMVLLHPAKTNKASEWTLECVTLLLVDRYISGNAGTQDDKESEKAARDNHATDVIPPHSTLHTLVEGITKCSESNIEGIQVAVVRAMLAIMTSPKCGIHEATLLMCIRATFHVYLITKALECKKHSRLALMDMMQSVFNRMEAYDAIFRSEKPMEVVQHTLSVTNIHGNITHHVNGFENGEKKDLSRFASQFHTDGYLLFRALCKLSSKPLPGDENKTSTVISFVGSTPVDPLALNSKILSLELLAAVLEYCGNAFRTGDKFIYAVQNYLCVSLLKNCMSNNTQVAYLSQKIFLILVYKFKVHLKSEIEVFMSNIFLRVLESPNSSFEQKALVLEALRSLCIDPVLLTQIFLNYDCDFDAVNLYKEIVHNLTKLSGKATSQQTSNLTKKEIEQDFELSLAGVEVLVTILKAFLNALGLPGGDEDPDEDSATSRLRGLLQIDVGLAAKPPVTKHNQLNISQADESFSAGDFQPSVSSESSNVAGKIVNAFESKRAAEQNFELGTVKFALSLKDGLKYFIDNGFVDLDAKAIALFFIENKNKLDKTMIGEALGREPDAAFVKDKGLDPEKGGPGFFFRILNHYADSFQFAGLVFDDAIRQFQSGFRLPGEAQKIDRIMEKFAERFTRQNFDVFPSADTAFILAFSIIMLNTDLHSPNIKEEKKMTLDSFIRNNRGIADGADLPKEYLTGIFTRIKASPFSLKEDDEARERAKEADLLDNSIFFEGPSFFGSSAEDRRKEKFKKEREEMMNATELLFKKRKSRTVSANVQMTDSIAPSDVVKPMFDVTWGPLIGTLSQVLECSNDERSIAVCLNGFVYAVRIAAHSEMSLARDTFVNSLGKFTFLGSIKEMRHKNIESIRTLLSIAVIDGEYLNESWGPVLQCISQLARLRLFASGLESDESFLADLIEVGSLPLTHKNWLCLTQVIFINRQRPRSTERQRKVTAEPL